MNHWLHFPHDDLLEIAEAFEQLHESGDITFEQKRLWREILEELEARPRPVEVEHLDEIYNYDA